MNKKLAVNIITSILIVGAIAGLSALFTSFNMDWYNSLNKSFLSPPNYVFSIVWSALYILQIAALVVLRSKGMNKTTWIYFLLNGLLNILWCLFFFTLKLPELALLILVLNIAFAALYLKNAQKISELAFYLLLPYALWLCYALVLNYSIVMLN